MTDNEIIKALECCQSPTAECKNCPMPKDIQDDCRCMETISRNALSIIIRQKAEIERLHKEVEYWEAETKEARSDIDQAVAEAIKECIDKMKPWYRFLCVDEGDWCQQLEAHAYNLVKEMVGDE